MFRGLRAFVLTGTADIDHPREIDEEIVKWLNDQGAMAEFSYLAHRGIVGNGHMLMIEQNSRQISDIIIDWLDGVLADESKNLVAEQLTS
jgi:hypothetical protein